MKKWMKFILIALGFPKSLWICFRSFPFLQAIKLPIIVSPNTIIVSTKGEMKICGLVRFGMVSFGLGGYGLSLHEPCVIQNNGVLLFYGKNRFGGGTRISCNSEGVISFGDRNEFVGNCQIICNKSILIGDRCLVSWDTQIMDSDMHRILDMDLNRINHDASVCILDDVWICSKVVILKGARVGANTVVGCNSIVLNEFNEINRLICGIPAKIVKKDIKWEN